MITENLSTLKINKLTNEQFKRAFEAGNISETEIYLTPDEGSLPEVTEADNGKILMVVNGTWQLVNLNLSVDANGVLTVG